MFYFELYATIWILANDWMIYGEKCYKSYQTNQFAFYVHIAEYLLMDFFNFSVFSSVVDTFIEFLHCSAPSFHLQHEEKFSK